MLKKFLIITFFLTFFTSCENDINDPSEKDLSVPLMNITIEHEDLVALKNNRTLNFNVPCRIKFKGAVYNGEIRASGAGSRYYPKWSYRIELKEGESIEGINEFNLSAQVEDKSMIRTIIAGRLYENAGLLNFKNLHVFVRINNNNEGLYLFLEVINNNFFARRNLPVNELYKLGFASSFTYSPASFPEFTFSKQIPDDGRFYTLTELINILDESNAENVESSVGSKLNLENYLSYHSLTSIIGNVDAFGNNFCLYKKTYNSPFEIIPWDFDKSFYIQGNFGLVGDNGIIKKLFTNESVFNQFKNIMTNQVNDIYDTDVIFEIIDSTASAIESSYDNDISLGQSGLIFNDEVESLKNYILQRKEYILNNLNNLKQDYFTR